MAGGLVVAKVTREVGVNVVGAVDGSMRAEDGGAAGGDLAQGLGGDGLVGVGDDAGVGCDCWRVERGRYERNIKGFELLRFQRVMGTRRLIGVFGWGGGCGHVFSRKWRKAGRATSFIR